LAYEEFAIAQLTDITSNTLSIFVESCLGIGSGLGQTLFADRVAAESAPEDMLLFLESDNLTRETVREFVFVLA
jgi:hypothetical protein